MWYARDPGEAPLPDRGINLPAMHARASPSRATRARPNEPDPVPAEQLAVQRLRAPAGVSAIRLDSRSLGTSQSGPNESVWASAADIAAASPRPPAKRINLVTFTGKVTADRIEQACGAKGT